VKEKLKEYLYRNTWHNYRYMDEDELLHRLTMLTQGTVDREKWASRADYLMTRWFYYHHPEKRCQNCSKRFSECDCWLEPPWWYDSSEEYWYVR
jgi:hypothetical protein